RRRLLLPGGEAGEERGRDGGGRHRVVDGLLQRPAALPGVRGVVVDARQPGVLLEGVDEQLEQPGPHDGAALPGPDHGGDVGDEVTAGGHDLVALGVGLHEAVLDAVVDHLGEVPGTHWTDVDEPLLPRALRSQRVEDQHEPGDVLGAAADHGAVTVLAAPHAARDTGVDVSDAALGEHGGVVLVVAVVGVAALDDEVSGGQHLPQLGQLRHGGWAGGHHDPHDALPGGHRGGEVGECGDVADRRVGVVPGDGVSRGLDTSAHVAAHAAHTDHPHGHESPSRAADTVLAAGQFSSA